MIDKEERRKIRRLLWKWGRVTEYCAHRHRDMIEYIELMDAVGDIKPQTLSGMPHGTDVGNPTERLAELRMRYAERIDCLSREIDKELRLSHDIDELIAELEPIEQTILDLRYKGGKSYMGIADELNYCERQVKRTEYEAIEKLAGRIYFTNMS